MKKKDFFYPEGNLTFEQMQKIYKAFMDGFMCGASGEYRFVPPRAPTGTSEDDYWRGYKAGKEVLRKAQNAEIERLEHMRDREE